MDKFNCLCKYFSTTKVSLLLLSKKTQKRYQKQRKKQLLLDENILSVLKYYVLWAIVVEYMPCPSCPIYFDIKYFYDKNLKVQFKRKDGQKRCSKEINLFFVGHFRRYFICKTVKVR